MKEIKRSLAFLTINDRHLDRNFTFKVIRSSQSLITSASVSIKRKYFMGNRISINEGDKIYLSIQNNSEEKVLIFQGNIQSVSYTGAEIHLIAVFRLAEQEDHYETYKDSSLQNVLEKLISHKLTYEASSIQQAQFICQGKKETTLKRLLGEMTYFIDLNEKLVVRNEPKAGLKYTIDKCLCNAKSDMLVIFPIPELEINDIVEVQGQSYIVKDIAYRYLSQVQMVLGVKKYEGKQEVEFVPETQSVEEASKPAPEGYTYFENAEKLNELSEGARKHFIKIAREVYEDYKNAGIEREFQNIYISSAWRSRTNQFGILSGKLDKIRYPILDEDGTHLKDENGNYKYWWTKNTYEYYQDTAVSSKYLKVIQYLYDGVYDHRIGSPTRELYLADLNAIKDITKRKIFQDIIEEKYNDTEYVVDSYKKGDSEDNYNIKLLIKKAHVDAKLFNPSHHVTDTPYKNANALDIRFLDRDGKKYEPTAGKFYNKNGGENSGYKGYNHYHMTP